MKIGRALNRVIERYLITPSERLNIYRTIDIHGTNINKLFVNTYEENNSIEVPVFIMHELLRGYTNVKTVIPLGVQREFTYKTVDSIISYLFKNSSRGDEELLKVTSEKFGTYYGYRGLILDSNFEVLLMSVVNFIRENNTLKPKEFIVYIHPKVSLSENGVEKTIYTKIVPKCLTEEFTRPYGFADLPYYSKVKVIFEDITNKFFTKPIAPIEDLNQSIHELLVNNIDILAEMSRTCR